MSGIRYSSWGPSGAREDWESWLDFVSVFKAEYTSSVFLKVRCECMRALGETVLSACVHLFTNKV